MRCLLGFVCVLALGFMGCSETAGTGGTAGDGGAAGMGGGGVGGAVACTDDVCPCTEPGIRAAIAEGGGPFTFDCDGPTTVVTKAEIAIDNDVILDGESNLTLDGDDDHRLLSVAPGVDAGLIGLSLTGGRSFGGGALKNEGTLGLTGVAVSDSVCAGRDCFGGGIQNLGTMTLKNSTVSGNNGGIGDGIFNLGDLSIANSTVSGNPSASTGSSSLAIVNGGTTALIQSTIEGGVVSGFPVEEAVLTISNSLVVGPCECHPEGCAPVSNGYNIESPGDTCGFDQSTDQVNVTADDLRLGELADNGGPTLTHALGGGSVAIDVIPEVECVDADDEPLTTDQRGLPRDSMCDVGAFEVQP